jgi:chorismate mutase/prephenate dehydratase
MDRLKFFRKRLNTLDREIAVNIARKIDLVREVWSWKKANNIPLIDKKREKEIIEKNSEVSGLDKKFLKKIYEEVRKEIRRQFKE